MTDKMKILWLKRTAIKQEAGAIQLTE